MKFILRVFLAPVLAGVALASCDAGSGGAIASKTEDGAGTAGPEKSDVFAARAADSVDAVVDNPDTDSTAGAKAATISFGSGCLPGTWLLDNTSLAVAMTNSMRTSTNGTDFKLESIDGDYLAQIDPDDSSVIVTWKNWIMKGTATTRDGVFPVRLRLDGRQDYDLGKLTETTMEVALKRNAVDATVTFAGMTVTDPKVDIPQFSGGSWSCNVDDLTVVSDGHKWDFERADW